jgi:exopolysaccharide production protein ExoZ
MKFDSIQVFRAIAANAVVMSHLLGIEGKYGKGFVVLPDWIGQAGPAGVHFFFVISGCVMVFASRGVKWSDFMLSRMIRIYPIYWFYTSIFILVIVLAPQYVSFGLPSPASILKSYLLWPDSSAPLLTVGWSLIFEMYFYMVLTLALALAVPLRLAIVLWTGLTILIVLLSPQGTPLIMLISSPLTFEFIAGAMVGFVVLHGYVSYRRTALVAGVASLVVGFIRYVSYALPNDASLITVVSLAIPFSLILYAGLSFECVRRWPKSSWMVLLGDASYSTYLSHSLVLTVAGRIFLYAPISGWAAEATFVLFSVVAANLVGILSYIWLERPSLKLCRTLLGAPTRTGAVTP